MPLHTSVAALALVAGTAAAQTALPTIAPGNTTDTFFGTAVADPYRRLEDTKDKTVAAWMKAHSEHAHRSLQALPQRAALLASIKKYDDAPSARVVEVSRVPGGRLFYRKRGPADDQYKLYTRDAQGRETLLVDPATFARKAGGKPHAINWFTPSPDGRRVAYGVSAAGSESATLYVTDVASRRLIGSPIPRADFGGATWTEDAGRLYFVQLQEVKAGTSSLEKYRNSRVVWVTPDTRALPRPVLEPGTPGVQIAPEEIPFLALSADGRYAFAFVINGVQREQRVYAADQRAFLAGKAQWKLLYDRDAQIVGGAYAEGTLYAVTYKNAPRYKLIAGAVDGFDPAKASTVIAAGDKVLTGVAAAADALYIEQREGNVKRLAKLAHARDGRVQANATPTPVVLPIDGAFVLNGDEGGAGAADPRLPGLLIDLQGWTRARQIYEVAADGSVRNTGLQPAGPYDAPQDLVTTELQCKSHDGALVPMSVIHKKGLALDGKQPTLLYGYASYGFTEEPFFSTGRLAWMDAGGVYAVANPRGTSVFGQDWYKAGFQTRKANTWKDFIACAETLIANKYTSPAHLGILGGSAGGILVGRAMTERPDLFAAVISAVGSLDMVRAEVTPNGIPNIPEFGTRANEAGFRALLEMSTLHQIKDGVKYPAVLLTHGVNDPRVEVWESTKAAARLMAASTSGRPVLLRLDYDAGHGVGSTKAQQQAERADIYAFLLWQLGGGR
jgi:prolyl oligopeptidase